MSYTYQVIWSQEDGEYVGLCPQFPSLSWLDSLESKALEGIQQIVASISNDMQILHFED